MWSKSRKEYSNDDKQLWGIMKNILGSDTVMTAQNEWNKD